MQIRLKKTKTPRLILHFKCPMLNPLSCCFELLRVSRMMDTDDWRLYPSAQVFPIGKGRASPRVALDGKKNKGGEGMN
jgi:hypothetical protein